MSATVLHANRTVPSSLCGSEPHDYSKLTAAVFGREKLVLNNLASNNNVKGRVAQFSKNSDILRPPQAFAVGFWANREKSGSTLTLYEDIVSSESEDEDHISRSPVCSIGGSPTEDLTNIVNIPTYCEVKNFSLKSVPPQPKPRASKSRSLRSPTNTTTQPIIGPYGSESNHSQNPQVGSSYTHSFRIPPELPIQSSFSRFNSLSPPVMQEDEHSVYENVSFCNIALQQSSQWQSSAGLPQCDQQNSRHEYPSYGHSVANRTASVPPTTSRRNISPTSNFSNNQSYTSQTSFSIAKPFPATDMVPRNRVVTSRNRSSCGASLPHSVGRSYSAVQRASLTDSLHLERHGFSSSLVLQNQPFRNEEQFVSASVTDAPIPPRRRTKRAKSAVSSQYRPQSLHSHFVKDRGVDTTYLNSGERYDKVFGDENVDSLSSTSQAVDSNSAVDSDSAMESDLTDVNLFNINDAAVVSKKCVLSTKSQNSSMQSNAEDTPRKLDSPDFIHRNFWSMDYNKQLAAGCDLKPNNSKLSTSQTYENNLLRPNNNTSEVNINKHALHSSNLLLPMQQRSDQATTKNLSGNSSVSLSITAIQELCAQVGSLKYKCKTIVTATHIYN